MNDGMQKLLYCNKVEVAGRERGRGRETALNGRTGIVLTSRVDDLCQPWKKT